MIHKDRFDRQLSMFGEEGQTRIERNAVAIVGLGGIGSHVAQQLAYLGVRRFALIDKDTVSISNLNRLIGAKESDARENTPKVLVASRNIAIVSPQAQIEAIEESLVSTHGFDAVKRADFVFGCVDRDGVRLILNELCSAYSRPYLDAASDIRMVDDQLVFGGRVLFAYGGRQCLVCKDELDQEAMRLDLSAPDELVEDEQIYGIPREALRNRGPAVVSVNGIVASMAVTEYMAFVTGLRDVREHLVYDGQSGKVFLDQSLPRSNCYYCKALYNTGVLHDVEHYIRDGVGDYL